jgi:glycosyltransferase involved in cell wall biosynthesis
MILIDALYVNNGGGKILLEYLIEFVVKTKNLNDFFFVFDIRLNTEKIKKLKTSQYTFLKPKERARLNFYKKQSCRYHSFICFANVPPPITIKEKSVIVYFHNVLLLDSKNSNLNLRSKLLLSLKLKYIKYLNKENYKWAVQTLNVSNQLENRLGIEKSKIVICPIFNVDLFYNCNKGLAENNVNYLYVADGSPQKNHINLIKAWSTLNKTNRKLILHLTLEDSFFQDLINEFQKSNHKHLSIINHGWCSPNQIRDLYRKCNYLVYPSLAESFGLPLIEAAASGCKVISADLPYVYEVVAPSLVFNPSNLVDIINALEQSIYDKNISPTILKVDNKIELLFNTYLYV